MPINHKDRPDISSVVRQAVARHGPNREAIVPILAEVNQVLGYLPAAALTELSRSLRLADSHLFSLATFYHMLSTQPRGRHVVQFCESAPCHVMGGREVWQALQAELKLEPGETSADKNFTLLTVSCPGLCDVAPVLIIDEEVNGKVVAERVPELLSQYKKEPKGGSK